VRLPRPQRDRAAPRRTRDSALPGGFRCEAAAPLPRIKAEDKLYVIRSVERPEAAAADRRTIRRATDDPEPVAGSGEIRLTILDLAGHRFRRHDVVIPRNRRTAGVVQ
jgi:hypothetical protein